MPRNLSLWLGLFVSYVLVVYRSFREVLDWTIADQFKSWIPTQSDAQNSHPQSESMGHQEETKTIGQTDYAQKLIAVNMLNKYENFEP